MSAPFLTRLGKLLPPLVGCVLLGGALYFEGAAYQATGAEALETGWKVLGYVLSIGLILSLAVFLQRLVRYVLLDGLIASALGGPVPRLLSQLSGLLIFLVAFGAIAGFVFKQDLTVLWAASGVAGVVLGMALRELLMDIFTGLALNLDRPIKIGDHVRLHRTGDITIEGRVMEISWRSTRIRDDFANVIIVPNSRIAAATITNHSQPQTFLEFMSSLTLDAGVPADRALRILEAAATEASLAFAPADAPPPYIRLRAVTGGSVEYGIFFFPPVEARFRARSLVLQHALRHLERAGLRPAWPKEERADGDPASTAGRAADPAILVPLLGEAEPLRGLPDGDLAVLAGTARLRRLPAGLTLVQAGETAPAFYAVVEGLLSTEPAASRGRAAPTATTPLGPGSLVGAAALFLGSAYSETVRCRTDALVAELTLDGVRLVLERRPEAARDLARQVALHLTRSRSGRGDGGQADLAAEVLSNLRRATGVGGLAALDS